MNRINHYECSGNNQAKLVVVTALVAGALLCRLPK